MHKPLTRQEVEALNAAVPVMSRTEKLERWASLLEKCGHLEMAHLLEHMHPVNRDMCSWPGSPMAVAAADPVLVDAGLKGSTVKDAREFFELTDEQIHAFSCNCGGRQTGEQMASRVRGFAQGPF